MLRVKSIRPSFTKIITTADKYDSDNTVNGGAIIDNKKLKGSIKEYQTIVKVGSAVRDYKVGDVVVLDPTKYMKRKFNDNSLREDFVENPVVSINIPMVIMDDKEYFMIDQSDILYAIDDYEEVPDTLEVMSNTIITPKAAKIIL